MGNLWVSLKFLRAISHRKVFSTTKKENTQ